VLDQAKSKGAKGDDFDKLEQRLKEADQISALDIAVQLRDSGEFNQAINILKDETNQFPEDADMLALLSHCYLLADQLEEAKLYLSKAKKIAPDNASVGWNTARLMLKEQKPLEAVNVARDTSRRFPEDIEGMGVLGACLRANGEVVESLEILNGAIELNPDYAEALINRGLIRLSQENKTDAVADLEMAHRLKPHIKQIWDLVVGLKVEGQDYSDAIPLLIKMIEIDPEDEKRLAALALCYQHLKDFAASEESYKKALTLKPDYVEAHINLGSAFKEQGKLEEAIEAYTKALAIKPDYAEAYYNMGVTLNDQGKLEEAIEAYNKALAIKPDYVEAWNNIIFPLQAIKLKVSSQAELVSFYPKDTGSNHYEIYRATLNHILNQGTAASEKSLSESLRVMAKADVSIIKNPKRSKGSNGLQMQLTDDVVSLVHWGRSGTGLLHSLIDGHPEVSTLPSIYLSEYFAHSTWERIISGGWSKMADRFMAIYDVLFDAASTVPVQTKSNKLISNIGRKEGMANVGDQRDEVLSVDKEIFRAELQRLMNCYDQLDALLFFKLVHRAYDKAIEDIPQKNLIFYHIHNPDTHAQLNFVRLVPGANWVMMVREPVQSCESWLRLSLEQNDYTNCMTKIRTMLFDIDNIIYHKQNSVGVRLEDLKEYPRQTISALCNWMGIEETESLYEMTAQGKKWWGDPSSPDFAKDGMNPFGKTSINRKIGSIFSESDQFILRTLFYPFSVRFGYVEENAEQFEIDLQTIRPMLDEMFDFQKMIAQRNHHDQEQFMTSGLYLYLRSGLIERWETLKEFGTYPHMIQPLTI
jgi:tetratricopeptide (TPR) repeat protein